MTEESLQKHFKSMGARVKFRSAEAPRRRLPTAESFTIDIRLYAAKKNGYKFQSMESTDDEKSGGLCARLCQT